MIVRPIEVVSTWKRIAAEFDVSVSTAKKWRNEGAPIRLIDGEWKCDKAELWTWLDRRADKMSAA